MSKTKIEIKDDWSTDSDYKDLYQADRDILNIIELLDLEKRHALLDNACGNGEVSIQAALRYPDLRVYGYDALDSAIAEARQRASRLKNRKLDFNVAWADDLPLDTDSVDRALFRNALHHINDPCAVFSEMARCLVSSGLLVIQAPVNIWEDSFSGFLSEFHLLMDDSHRRYYHTVKTIKSDLKMCGLHSISDFVSAYDYPFVTEPMKDLIVEYNFEERLQLKQIAGDKWSVTLHWVKLVAKNKMC